MNKGTHGGNKKVPPQQIHEQIISELCTVSSGLIYMELESLKKKEEKIFESIIVIFS